MYRPITALASLALLAALAGPDLTAAPKKKDPTKGLVASGAKVLHVRVSVESLHCIKPTERNILKKNRGDEVYFVVAGKAPSGLINKRLPGDKDYYRIKKGQKLAAAPGWKNKDGKDVGRPILFAGSLKPGQHVRLTMLMIEQDSKVLAKIIQKLAGIFRKVSGIATGIARKEPKAIDTVQKVLDEATKVLKSDGNDYLGSVTLVVRNDNGKLQVSDLAGAKTRELGKGLFEMTGSGARYKVALSAK
jgi:hypothetical protein